MARASTSHSIGCRIGTREDYVALASMADEFGADFTALAERFEERGLPLDTIRDELARGAKPQYRKSRRIATDTAWVTTAEAEKLVPGIYVAVRDSGIAPRRKSRSKSKSEPVAGAGWLWYFPDLQRIAKIGRTCKLRCTRALMVWQLERDDRLSMFRVGCLSCLFIGTNEASQFLPLLSHKSIAASQAFTSEIVSRRRRWCAAEIECAAQIVSTGISFGELLRVLKAIRRGEI